MKRFLTRGELTSFCSQYERNHDVERYRCFDWNVWPLLRISICFQGISLPPSEQRLASSQGAPRKSWRLALARSLKTRIRATFSRTPGRTLQIPASEIVIFGPTGYGFHCEGGANYYSQLLDPLYSVLCTHATTSIWTYGTGPSSSFTPTIALSPFLNTPEAAGEGLLSYEAPTWFSELSDEVSSLFEEPYTWPQARRAIQAVEERSRLMQSWLQKSRSRLLMHLGWYGGESLAANLAASRLKIPTVDVQHGLQDDTHFAYAGWNSLPKERFALIPNWFWTWGRAGAEALTANNPTLRHMSRTVVGGNPWLNFFLETPTTLIEGTLERARKSVGAASSLILVTQQPGYAIETLLREAIERAPKDWKWVLRLHPRTEGTDQERLSRAFAGIEPGRIAVVPASDVPLFALLKYSTCHITSHSTSTLEALAFGVPTVVVTAEGKAAFRELIDRQVVFSATDPAGLLDAIRRACDLPHATYTSAARTFFARPQDARSNLEDFLGSVGVIPPQTKSASQT